MFQDITSSLNLNLSVKSEILGASMLQNKCLSDHPLFSTSELGGFVCVLLLTFPKLTIKALFHFHHITSVTIHVYNINSFKKRLLENVPCYPLLYDSLHLYNSRLLPHLQAFRTGTNILMFG